MTDITQRLEKQAHHEELRFPHGAAPEAVNILREAQVIAKLRAQPAEQAPEPSR